MAEKAINRTLLTIQQVSEMTAIPIPTLRCWRLEGRGLPVVKIEGLLRYRLSDIEAYIRAHTETPSVRDAVEELSARL